MDTIRIGRAAPADLADILALQKCAYQSEADLLGDDTIPPLRQTLEDIEAEYEAGVILKATDAFADRKIIGSVRGRIRDGSLHIGKLIVHPSRQGQGIGSRLLSAVESLHPGMRCELFTSSRSARNIALYQKNGYREFKRLSSDGLVLVFLEKLPAARA